jgi:hypothetical protein
MIGASSNPFEWLRPDRLIAVELRQQVRGGASKPLIVDCQDSEGKSRSVILKLRDPGVPDGKPWGLCLVRDLVGGVLARQLGLATPDYAIVEVTKAFAKAVQGHTDGVRIAANIGANFGSAVLTPVLEPPVGTVDDWAEALGFDALAFNPDRKGGNPNALWDGNHLYLIDHGMMAPTWTFRYDGTHARSLFGPFNIRAHAGYPIMNGRGHAFSVTSQWDCVVTSDFLTWLRGIVPPTWASPSDLDALFRFLSERRHITTQQCNELKGVVG